MSKTKRNPKKCKWAKDFDGVYVCRGNCLPCKRVTNNHCDMEDEYWALHIEQAELIKSCKKE